MTAALNLVEVYKNDLDECLRNELVQFAEFVNAFKEEQAKDLSQENFFYQSRNQFRSGNSTPRVPRADEQQLQCGAFVLKDETDKEQTLHIHVGCLAWR